MTGDAVMQAARRVSEGRGKRDVPLRVGTLRHTGRRFPSLTRRAPGAAKSCAGWNNGSVLLVVLVVIALLALGAYTFSEFMIIEAEATSAYGREVQARAAADSGVEMAASLLSKRFEE